MNKEGFKAISGFENYMISERGEVYSIKRKKIMKTFKDSSGYMRISLVKNNKKHTKKVHRLVAEAFIQNKHNKPQVNHINGIKDDNRVVNLEWCTESENQKHCYKIGLRKKFKGEGNPNSKLTNKQVDEIKEKYKSGLYSYKELGKEYGVTFGRIGQICNNNYRGINE